MRAAFRNPVRALFLFAVVFTAACASTPAADTTTTPPAGGGAAATTSTVISIDNNLSTSSAVTVFLQPEAGGVRQSVGSIDAASSREFTLNVASGQYVLVAQRPSGDLRSERFNVAGPSNIAWDLQFNRVRVTRR